MMVLEHRKEMTTDEAVLATRDERIASVAKFIESKAKSFWLSLKPRERANFGVDDIAIELYIIVAERDHKWVPDNGKYITFVGAIITRALEDLRDRARTVQSPRNSTCRMREYDELESKGELSDDRRKSAGDIQRTRDGFISINGSCGEMELPYFPGDASESSERADEARRIVEQAIGNCLSLFEAQVIGLVWELWERNPIGETGDSVGVIAWRLRREPAEVRRARDHGMIKIRRYLEGAGIKYPQAPGVSCTSGEDHGDAEDGNL